MKLNDDKGVKWFLPFEEPLHQGFVVLGSTLSLHEEPLFLREQEQQEERESMFMIQ